MLKSMNKLITELNVLTPGTKVLCAVSGGADSVCLLHALYRLRPKLGIELAAAHFDHRLRGEESRRDGAFAAQFTALCCGQQRLADGRIFPAVPFFSGSGDVAGEAAKRGTGLEETARDLRYEFLRRTAREVGADYIATAHNADDNVETILFHLARGTGLRGLTGIQPLRGDLIRPLLTTTRREIEDYLTYHGLPHVDDRTNFDDTYARNRIRHQVTPILEELCPGFTARTADTAALLRADEDYLTGQARELADVAIPLGQGLAIPADLIGDAPDPVAARAVRLLIGRLNGGDQDCGSAHLFSVLRLCRGSDPSAQVHLPYGLIARREYGDLVLTHEKPLAPLVEQPLAMPGKTAAGEWVLTCQAGVYQRQLQLPFDFWLAREKAPALAVRARRTGDALWLAFRPRKTVKKWLIDEKIPAHLRDTLPLLDCGGAAAAMAGLGPDVEFMPEPGEQAWHIIITPLQHKPGASGTPPL